MISIFKSRHKNSSSIKRETKSEAIKEFERLEGTFIRLRNLAAIGKERIKNSDRERRAKMEGYMQAFSHAAEQVNKAIKNLKKKEKNKNSANSKEIVSRAKF